MRALALVLALTTPALAACSGDPDEGARAESVSATEDEAFADWRAAIEDELGTSTFDLATYQQAAAVDCMRTTAAGWTVELALSGDTATSGLTRVGLEHACEDVLPAFDEALAAVEAASDPLELVCGPGVTLADEAALVAELACAQR